MNKKLTKHDNEWFKLFYTEAWKQYIHEDNLGQGRMNIFLIVHTALFAILTFSFEPLLSSPPIVFDNIEYHIGFSALGILMIVIGVFTYITSGYWKSGITAGGRYLWARWITIAAIEKTQGFDEINIANLEWKWKSFNKKNPGKKYFPYPDNEELKDFYIDPIPRVRGWSSMEKTITIIQGIDILILLMGIILVVISVMISG